jgi:small-conductance mechanosensitive channel
VRLLVIALAAVVAYPYVPGSGSQAFRGVSLFIGVIFSLGSSSLIGNVIAGYSMVYRKAFKIGDRVKIGQNTGDVEQMRLLVTHLRTIKNEELIIPNSTILSTEVVNYSSIARDQGLILHTTVGIGYETPWRQVEAMLLEAAARTPGLRKDPPPFVLQTLLGDFCITYEINVYCEKAYNMELRYADLHRNILDVFNEYGIQIMTPAYRGDPEQPKIVPQDQWYAPPAQTSGSNRSKTLGAGEA